jgi:hypothetical protein
MKNYNYTIGNRTRDLPTCSAVIDTTVKTFETFKNHLQDIALHSCIQYSWLIALSTVCLILLSTDAHSTDTGLDTQFATDSLLHCATPYAVLQLKSPVTLSSTLIAPLSATHCLAVTRLSISRYPLASYDAYCTSRIYFAVLVTVGYP